MTSPQPPYEGQSSYPRDPARPPEYPQWPRLLDGTQQFPPRAPGLQPPGAAGAPKKSTTVKVVAIVAAVVVVVCCGGGASLALLRYKLNNTLQSTANNNSASDPPGLGKGSTDWTVAGKMGQAVNGHTFQYTVSKVKCGVPKVGTNDTPIVAAKGQFCLVTLTVKSISDRPMVFAYSLASANGVDGVPHQADGSAILWANYKPDQHLPFFGPMSRGDSQSGIVVFDIPKNVTLTNINLPDGFTARAKGTVSIATQPNSDTSPTVGTVSPSPTASAVVGKVGQAIDGHTFRFTVSKVKCGVAKVGSGATLFIEAKGQFCLVTLTVKNLSDTSTHFWADSASVNGRDGVAHTADRSAMVWANYDKENKRLSSWDEISPGDSPSAILVFDVPKNVTLTSINLPDSLTETGTVSIAVG
jgi:hypothetical protein